MSRPRLAQLASGSATVLLTVLLVLLLSGTTSTAWIALTCVAALALGVAVAYALRPQAPHAPTAARPPSGVPVGRPTASSYHR
ncbi:MULTISPECIES: hypothetical protein [unclassified Streptomyces]|uniref:Secreted protein n=1 Tax=Streptomyces evansiae TaxID=3075535 RepID=A0ABU2RBL5_9ACTN|nr:MULTISPECIES: hypothetical protein [unclassified Streptomyces]MDT0413782.1 hypothetical protein [Streptomyces sp. DSM 41979]MDT0425918.1 hypothetical protein [Streptomyces sp. DSM 41859]MYQ61392.1 hypothetical protein [Streptomyces sp. SID4926]MYR27461.1 hypothetical protein [Streptomyces sp. SID4945]NJA57481.1 hypothetical protein [Streptomyces sp. NEAU-H3]